MADPVLHSIDYQEKPAYRPPLMAFIPPLIIITVGIISGWFVAQLAIKSQTSSPETESTRLVMGKKNYGTKNTELFPDSTVGIIRKGGLKNEGTHHLERKGGESQTVYLVSSVLDLNEFVGKKVTVWGKTYEAQTAGWFMDVGYLEIQ